VAAADTLGTVLRAAGVEHVVSLADLTRDLVAITDADRHLLYLNEAGARMIRLTDSASVIGRPIGAITTERGAKALEAKQDVVLADGFWRGECELRDQVTGDVIPVETDCFLISHPDSGEPLGFLSLQRDITVRRDQERELARWGLVAGSSQEAMFTIDAAGTVTSWNPAAERVFGFTAEEALAGGVELVAPDYGKPASGEQIRQAFRGESPPPFEVTCPRKDGTLVTTEVTVALLQGAGADHPEVAVLARDVTEQRRIEAAARAGEVQLREMAQNMGEALWLRDIETARLLFVSPGYEKIFGAPRDELVDNPRAWLGHVHPGDRERARRFAEDEAGTDALEVQIQRSGEIRWILVRPFVISDAAGHPIRRGGVVEDITPSRREAARLAEVAELRRRLVTQAIEAEERERSRVSVALHDNVLQLLLAAGQDLDDALEHDLAPAVEHARATLQSAVKELRAAVRDLHPLVLDTLGAAAAIRQIGDDLARRGGFRLALDVDGEVPRPQAGLVVALAREFLSNAAHHADAHNVSVELRAGAEHIRLTVSDDGHGFPADRLAAAVVEGHIGLASSRERVESAGGTLDVHSGNGGTTVVMELPLRISA
jgi:PAS domain S-box-containing protein